MALPAGTRVGPYEITAQIGTGGMGEVYRATDTNLKRQVAIKVLPPAVAADVDRLARFQREAEALASLNHPHIAAIYGLERADGATALVMELVDGPTLADRIAQGPVPLDETRAVAGQIADALAHAHERGIVHRDLKPANVKVRHDGTVKVLDFGLAKALDTGPGPGAAELADSPTITTPAMTKAGVILGTAAYMSPEQARGRPVDRRTDIWAFGCVLYEMITARRAFAGDGVSDTIAAVLLEEPDLTVAPAVLRPLLAACLQKEPRKRLRDIASFEYLWDLGRADAASTHAPADISPVRDATVRPLAHRLPWALAAALATTTGLALWAPWRSTPVQDRPPVRFSVDLGPDAVQAPGISAVLSPDASRLVFVGRAPDGGAPLLYVRRLDQDRATALAGTESPLHQPFFSPDSQWIGFRGADGQIKKVPAQGGDVVTIGPWPGPGGSGVGWADDGNLIVGTWTGLWTLPAGGGAPRRLTSGNNMFPNVLPGSATAVFGQDPGTVTASLDDMVVQAVRLASGETKSLVQGGYWPHYLPTSGATGHLIYVRGGTLFGVGFDPARLELLGTPVPVLEDVAANAEYSVGGGQVSVSNSGTLAYVAGATPDISTPFVWLDPSGTTTPVMAGRRVYGAPRVSPDGRRLAYISESNGRFDVWIRDLARGTSTQLTFLGTVNYEVAWAPDSQHLVYADGRALWWVAADGAKPAVRLIGDLNGPRPYSFSPAVQGMTRLAFSFTDNGLPDVATVPLDVTDAERPTAGAVAPFLTEPDVVEVDPALSPDGAFLAYATTAASVYEEIYVRAFPGPGGLWKVSSGGGKFPAWSAATHQLLYLGGDNRIMAVDYTLQGQSFTAGPPHAWAAVDVRRTGVQQNFDMTPDGRRVVVTPRPVDATRVGNFHVTFVLNFFDELRRRVPVTGR